LISHTLPAHERASLITMIFSDDNQVEMVRQLSGDNAQTFIDTIDGALDILAPPIRRKCLEYLRGICGDRALLPRSLEIPLCYDPSRNPVCRGGYSDVWRGQYNGKEVAAKASRVRPTADLEWMKRKFCRDVVKWRVLDHPNVLPLLGVTTTEDRFVMVSEWMKNGNINEFVKADIEVDRYGLLRGVTKGLIYMHEQGIVHGNLKGANILIDTNGHARLTGFSILAGASDQPIVTSHTGQGGAVRWMSPELFFPALFGLMDSYPTKESDCYALGMVIYEVLSGQVPFAQDFREIPVMLKIADGRRPGRPQGREGAWFTDEVWDTLGRCWKHQPHERPRIDAVLQCLQGVARPLRSPSDMGEDVRAGTDGQLDVITSDSGQQVDTLQQETVVGGSTRSTWRKLYGR